MIAADILLLLNNSGPEPNSSNLDRGMTDSDPRFAAPRDVGQEDLSIFDWKSHHGLLLGRERLPNGLWN